MQNSIVANAKLLKERILARSIRTRHALLTASVVAGASVLFASQTAVAQPANIEEISIRSFDSFNNRLK
jgi:hypothetical protein